MEITVKLDELFQEVRGEDGYIEINLAEELKAEIIRKVVSESFQRVQKHLIEFIATEVSASVASIGAEKIRTIAEVHIASTKIEKYGREISFSEAILEQLTRQIDQGSLERTVRAQAESITKTLKAQYDLAFANQIVMGLQTQGLLKPEVAQLLLPKTE